MLHQAPDEERRTASLPPHALNDSGHGGSDRRPAPPWPDFTPSYRLICLFEASHDPVIHLLLLAVDALGVDLEQDLHGVASPGRDFRGGHSELSHWDTPACRRSYGLAASTEKTCRGTKARSRAWRHTR